jgi:hypothetical protein
MQPLTEVQHDGKTFLKAFFNEKVNYLYGDWIGYITRQHAIKGCTALLEWAQGHARAHHCVAMIADTRNVRGSWDPAIEWVEKNFNGPMYALGFRWTAIVMSKDLSAQVSAENMVASNRAGEIAYHSVLTLADAEAWIEKMRDGR